MTATRHIGVAAPLNQMEVLSILASFFFQNPARQIGYVWKLGALLEFWSLVNQQQHECYNDGLTCERWTKAQSIQITETVWKNLVIISYILFPLEYIKKRWLEKCENTFVYKRIVLLQITNTSGVACILHFIIWHSFSKCVPHWPFVLE